MRGEEEAVTGVSAAPGSEWQRVLDDVRGGREWNWDEGVSQALQRAIGPARVIRVRRVALPRQRQGMRVRRVVVEGLQLPDGAREVEESTLDPALPWASGNSPVWHSGWRRAAEAGVHLAGAGALWMAARRRV